MTHRGAPNDLLDVLISTLILGSIILRLDGGQLPGGNEEEADPVHLRWAVQQVPDTITMLIFTKSLRCYLVIDIQTY